MPIMDFLDIYGFKAHFLLGQPPTDQRSAQVRHYQEGFLFISDRRLAQCILLSFAILYERVVGFP